MGGAYCAVSEDASAMYWNPAGLVQIPKRSAIFMHTRYVADINYQYLAYAQRLSHNDVLGASAFLTDIGGITRTDADGNTLGSFSPRDQVLTLSYGKAVAELSNEYMDISMGVSLKSISSKMVESANSRALDFGLMAYHFGAIPFRLAAVMTNLGPGIRYDQELAPLPLTFKLGGAINPSQNTLFTADILVPRRNTVNFLFGTELATEPNELTRLCLRAGILTDGLPGFTTGVGVAFHFLSLDYAFSPMGELGNAHKVSLTVDLPFRSPVFQRRNRSIFTRKKSAPNFPD